MVANVPQSSNPKLSICISTLNRAAFIGKTIDSIASQLTDECELLILDNASTDGTQQLLSERAQRDKRIRYVRKETNDGLDRNYDQAIELSRGEYCWPMADDDLFKPGAVAAVLEVLQRDVSAVFVNTEFRNADLSILLQERFLNFDRDRVYGPWELDRMFVEFGDFFRYIAALVIKREIWLARNRKLYFGSLFIFVGIIFQSRFPSDIHVIARPLVVYRAGNQQTFLPQLMELLLAKWPALVTSLPIAESAKRQNHSARPWKHPYQLLLWRGAGYYTFKEYSLWLKPQLRRASEKALPLLISVLPGVIVNAILTLYLSSRGPQRLQQLDGLFLDEMRRSPYRRWRWSAAQAAPQPRTEISSHVPKKVSD